MTGDTHARRAGRRRRLRPWAVGTPVIVLACGSLFVVSAQNSEGTDLRPGRYTDLASLVGGEADRVEELQQRAAALDERVTALTEDASGRAVERLTARADRLEGLAGLEAEAGEGVTVVLADAPQELFDEVAEADGDVRPLIVHQQDIQAVVNAMWAGGAEAVTLQGQRIITTTGIKCEGNSVQLQGVPYPQPYVISAVGDQGRVIDALDDDRYVQGYRLASIDPTIDVGWDLVRQQRVEAPAYDGLLDLSFAEPVGG